MGDNSVLAHKSLSKIITEHILSSTPSLVWMEKRRHRGRYFSTYGYRKVEKQQSDLLCEYFERGRLSLFQGFSSWSVSVTICVKMWSFEYKRLSLQKMSQSSISAGQESWKNPSLSQLTLVPSMRYMSLNFMVQRDCLNSCHDLCSLQVEEDMEET